MSLQVFIKNLIFPQNEGLHIWVKCAVIVLSGLLLLILIIPKRSAYAVLFGTVGHFFFIPFWLLFREIILIIGKSENLLSMYFSVFAVMNSTVTGGGLTVCVFKKIYKMT